MRTSHGVEPTSVAAKPLGLSREPVRPAVVKVGVAVAGLGILIAGARLSVPFYPVPLTMQTLAVLLVGGILGPRLGVAAVSAYLALGLAGAPVFHGGLGGPAVLLGPTGGYLLGFLPAVILMDFVVHQDRRWNPGHSRGILAKSRSVFKNRPLFRDLAYLTAGALVAEIAIYLPGVAWLAFAYAGGDLSRAITLGVTPFILGEFLKMAVAVGAFRVSKTALGHWRTLPF